MKLRYNLLRLFQESGLTKKEAGFIIGITKMIKDKDLIERINQLCLESLGCKKFDFLVKIRALIVKHIYTWCDTIYNGLAGKYCTELYSDCGCQIIRKSQNLPIVEVDFVSDKYLWGETPRGTRCERKILELKSGDIMFTTKNDDGRFSYTVLRQHGHFPYHNC